MSSKLDQSLDDILSSQRKSGNNRRRSTRRSSGPAKPAPAGGIQKSTKPARGSNNNKTASQPPRGVVGESKIVVSNLVRIDSISPCFFSSSFLLFYSLSFCSSVHSCQASC